MNEDFIVNRITLPDTNEVLLWSRDGLSTDEGLYEPKIQTFGKVRYERNDTEGNVQSPTMQVKIRDEDRTFARRVATGQRIIGARVDVKRYYEDEYVYSGRVAEFAPDGDLGWTLRYRPRDTRLLGKIPSTRLTAASFPRIDREKALDVIAPWIWGLFENVPSTGATGGALPTYMVDTKEARRVVSCGWVTVLRVFRAKRLIPPSNYTVIWDVIDGIRYTIIRARAGGKNVIVTCDVQGYGVDPTQVPLKPGLPPIPFLNTPGTILINAAANLLLEDRANKPFVASHADVDSAAFTAADALRTPLVPYKMSVYLGEEMSGYDFLKEYQRVTGDWVSFDNQGRLTTSLGFVPADAGPVTTPHIREDHAHMFALQRQFDPRDKAKMLRATYAKMPADTKSGVPVFGSTGSAEGETDLSSRFAPAFV